jgi:type IV secretion system protein VirB11
MTSMAYAALEAVSPATGIYLRSALAPFADLLARDDVTDIYVNRPGELWFETLGGATQRRDDDSLNEPTLIRLARQVAALSHQGVSREHPLLSATLPDGSRIQVVAPPATRGPLAIAIRRHVAPNLALFDYQAAGAFTETDVGELRQRPGISLAVRDLLSKGDIGLALALAVQERLNILVSGGTSTGKTTFLNALIREIPAEERLILIEDTPELFARHANHVGLVAVRGRLGEAIVTADDLVSASMRMRPDRIILGEIRGIEALAFLRAVKSGHPGSMTTIHADSPETAIEQLVLLALGAGTSLSREDVRHYVTQAIDVFVQLGRKSGQRSIQRITLGAGF